MGRAVARVHFDREDVTETAAVFAAVLRARLGALDPQRAGLLPGLLGLCMPAQFHDEPERALGLFAAGLKLGRGTPFGKAWIDQRVGPTPVRPQRWLDLPSGYGWVEHVTHRDLLLARVYEMHGAFFLMDGRAELVGVAVGLAAARFVADVAATLGARFRQEASHYARRAFAQVFMRECEHNERSISPLRPFDLPGVLVAIEGFPVRR